MERPSASSVLFGYLLQKIFFPKQDCERKKKAEYNEVSVLSIYSLWW